MEIKQLSKDDRENYRKATALPEEQSYLCMIDFADRVALRIAQAASDNAVRQIEEWGNEDCPHYALTRHLNKPKHKKRECDICWQEPKKEEQRKK